MRAATPSAAAAAAVFDLDVLTAGLDDRKDRLVEAFSNRLERERERFKRIKEQLHYVSPQNQMLQKRQYLMNTEERLWMYMERNIGNVKNRLNILAEKLNGLSPLNKLSGGFGYISDKNNNLINSIEKVKSGNNVSVTLSDGVFWATVDQVHKNVTPW
jgi:exodeoxyribonuclease VII large subunit